MQSVLLVDDEPKILSSFSRLLKRQFRIETALDEASASRLLRRRRFDAVVCDLHLGGPSGLEVLDTARDLSPSPAFVMMTGHCPRILEPIKAMEDGVCHVLAKTEAPNTLADTIRASIEFNHTRPAHRSSLAGSSWRPIPLTALTLGSQTDEPVLIRGETGTGKSALAKEIHQLSRRAQAPFVVVNCPSIANGLLRNELFGHVRGAYTSAQDSKRGLVEAAEGGTLFFDEIGELDPPSQAALLRFIDSREYRQVGGEHTRTANVRLIAATNRDLEGAIEAGTFRQDLYERLKVLEWRMRPLRVRSDDIAALIESFRFRVAKEQGRSPIVFSNHAMEAIMRYSWPGNIRELQNLVRRLTATQEPNELVTVARLQLGQKRVVPSLSEVAPERPDLPPISLAGASAQKYGEIIEYRLILLKLRETGNNESQTAKELKYNRTTMKARLSKFEERYGRWPRV